MNKKCVRIVLGLIFVSVVFTGCKNTNKVKEPIITTMKETIEEVTSAEVNITVKETTTRTEVTTEESTTKTETTTPVETTQPQTTEKMTEKETTTKAQETTTAKKVIKFTTVEEVVYATGYTKVYADYYTTAKVVGELGKGNAVKRIGKGDGWSRIYFNDIVTYVPSEYLTTEKETEDGLDGDTWTNPEVETSEPRYRDDLANNVYEKILKLRKTEGVKYGFVKKVINPTRDDRLDKLAKKRCKEIVEEYSHNSKSNLFKGMHNCGENIHRTMNDGCGNDAFNGWYTSQGHYRNLIHGTNVGIACYEYEGVLYWVYIQATEPYLMEE